MDTFKEKYFKIANDTDVFNAEEKIVLKEMIQECLNNNGKNYFLFNEHLDTNILGFTIFGKIPFTDCAWDIYWLIVDKNYQGKGVGKKLLAQVENFLLKNYTRALIRVETSARKEYLHARNLYSKQGYNEIGRIPNFYSENDNLVTYYKKISLSTV